MASVYIQLPLVSSTVTGTISTTESAMTPSYAQSLLVNDSAVTTITKPAGAKKAKVMAGSNSLTLRVTVDGTTAPTATVGMRMESGRSEDFDAVGDLKAICETAGTGKAIFVHWSY